MRRRAGPVQQWVDSIPSPVKSNISVSLDQEKCTFRSTSSSAETRTQPKDIPCSRENYKHPNMTVSAPVDVPASPLFGASRFPSSLPHQSKLARDPSLQSDSSHCSSVESLLELRRADPEAVLLGLGFGGCSPSTQDGGPLSRIPKRFLQPSRLKGIAINDFVKHQQESSESLDSVSLGYRGLTGSPYVAPSEIVQKIMERLREHESHDLDAPSVYSYYDQQHSPMRQNAASRLSVLSPDNRLFLEQPRSRSPDMRNKRMILGHRSYAFDCDGDLIEIHSSTAMGGPNNCKDDGIVDIGAKMQSARAESAALDDERMKYINWGTTAAPCESYATADTGKQSRSTVHDHDDHEHSNYSPEGRRASEEHCGDEFARDVSMQGASRGHSDGLIEKVDDRYSECLVRKRKSLKRQPRVVEQSGLASDEEANRAEFRDSVYNEAARKMQQHEDEAIDSVDDAATQAANGGDFKSSHGHDIAAVITSHKDEGGCTDCCCHVDGTKCWRKVERIIQENKKLEDMVAKSRKEMAEIRGMLSNVLSVRLEPGF